MPKIKVDQEKCIGCGLCTSICEKTFVIEESTGKAKAKKSDVDEITCEKEAADSCPVSGIIIS